MRSLFWQNLEGILLMLKEVGCHQERIHKFVFEDNLLPLIKEVLCYRNAPVTIVRASIYVLRQFAFSDDMKELFAGTDSVSLF